MENFKFNSLLIILLLITVGCSDQTENTIREKASQTDNQELRKLYEADQGDRQSLDKEWSDISQRDRERRERVYEMLDSNFVQSSNDYANAAMIFQHGDDTVSSGMAVKLMRKSIELDSGRNKWLLAAAIDRDLMRKGKPQIYGTQYRRMSAEEPWQMYDLDTTQISDEERKEYGVETLSEQKEKLRMMNKKSLRELYQEGNTIDEIVSVIKKENIENSDLNISEMGLNSFGYQLMAENKAEEALKIFELNTNLYPNAYNTFDSYGECLIKLGKTEKGKQAYKKSLELNPKNKNAEKILGEMKKNKNRA